MDLPTTNDLKRIIIDDVPLIDVRAPVEFEAGAFPNAINLPLMNNEERRLVGICYKEKGNAEAVNLGHELVCGSVKQDRVCTWIKQLQHHPETLIYCFRGGLRSQISQQWIAEASGIQVPRLEKGYKAFRNFLIDQLDPGCLTSQPVILGGRTGNGKTILLQQLDNAVDLELIANHRGSTFGRFTTPQPGQIDFENNLAWALVKHTHQNHQYLILEDEGRNVGDRYLPKPLVEHFRKAPLVLLERPLDERIEITFNEYVTGALNDFRAIYGPEQGDLEWLAYMHNCIDRIKKRLGGLRYQEIKELLQTAFDSGETAPHRRWIERLLVEYYDPMYDYQIQNKISAIAFKGNATEVLDYLKALD